MKDKEYVKVSPNYEVGQKICDMFYKAPYLEFVATICMVICKVSEGCDITKESFDGVVKTFSDRYHEMMDKRGSGGSEGVSCVIITEKTKRDAGII